jgi:hypothetical protein
LEAELLKKKKRCENAVAWACDYIGDHKRAAGLFESECANGKPRSCHRFGTMLKEGLGVRQDTARGESLRKNACGHLSVPCAESGAIDKTSSNSALHKL